MCYTALRICSYFGLDDLLLNLLGEGNLPVNTTTNMGTTPIIKAASKGHISTVRLLLNRAADQHMEI
jgi:ankyrin repeat protein